MTAEGRRHQNEPGGGTPPGGPAPLDQAFDGGSLYALRAAVAAHAATAGLGRLQVYDVTAVAHELAANAVVHGAGHGRLRLWADGGFLYCQVSDDGPAAPADEAGEAPDGAAVWPAEHGHGLWLASQVANDVGIGIGPAGTTATARFPLSPE